MPEKFDSIQRKYSIQEYLDLDSTSLNKYEYFNGNIYEIPGASGVHNLIATRFSTLLNVALDEKPTPYFVMNSDIKIFIPKHNAIVYPDAVVICETIEYFDNENYIITNPLLVVEVLSASTEGYDRGMKFDRYKTIPSFKEYVLVEQKYPYVESRYKIETNTWQETYIENLEENIYLKSIDIYLKLKDIYKGVTF